jgi:NAD(P)-dependent dehydrogenase (short-subunit alcohol dehydrogenase family)
MPLPPRPRVVVTGSGSGLGRAFCLELARRDARVIVSDVDLAAAEQTVASMRGGEGIAARCDVTRSEEVEALAELAWERLGGVDLLINNAGVAATGLVGEVPLSDWSWVLAVNLWGVIHGCHHFVPRMLRDGRGHVLNVASAAGLLSGPMMAPYNVSKAGVVALSETMRADLARRGIGVSVLCPTFFQTNIAKSGRGTEQLQELFDKLVSSGKLTAEDVARKALAGVDHDELYIAPHADGRWMWRVKRLAPGRFYEIMPKLVSWQIDRMRRSAR